MCRREFPAFVPPIPAVFSLLAEWWAAESGVTPPRKATKSAGTEFVIPYTGARADTGGKRSVYPSFPCTKTEKGSIISPAMRGEFRGIWRVALRMQGVKCPTTPSLHCVFYLPCDSIIILNLPKFNWQYSILYFIAF